MPRLQKDDVFRILTPHQVEPHPYNIACTNPNKLGVVPDYQTNDSDECDVSDSLWVVTGIARGVSASELDEDNSKPTGRTIFFYQSGCFNNMLEEDEIEVVGRIATTKTVYEVQMD